MKVTALFRIHQDLGAKMVPFAGFQMPLEYSAIRDEHVTVRNAMGVFDVSHMGEFRVKGAAASEFLQRVTSNDIYKLYEGKIQYSCFPNGRGGIVDDLLVYQMGASDYMLVVNAANIEKDWNWLVEQNREGATLENDSGEISQLAVQGPHAIEALQKITPVNLSEVKYYTFVVGEISGVPEVIISATGYTGAGGFELYLSNADAEKIWNSVMEAGKDYGIKPAGLAARDTLRLEMGYCLYGNDINDTTSPIEAGLGWITKFTDNNPFIDRDLLWKQKDEGVKRKLVGFELMEKGIPRQHYDILDGSGKVIGEVTSGTMSPMMNKGIGMGYVPPEMAHPDQEIYIQIRNKRLKAKVVSFPIYKEVKSEE
jgi:aminomethyltransferase